MTATETSAGTPAGTAAARAAALWALGDYHAVATGLIASMGPRLVEATGLGPGQRVLDLAAGTGNAALPAARAGADVVASDITPELLEAGRRDADREGLRIAWHVDDAEDLPYEDAEFDAVVSCVGVMFAPHHRAAADELVRVVRPGGTIGMISWTPEGFIGRMFAAMKPFAPAPPAGAEPPPLWGDEAHVRGLLGERVTGLALRRERLVVDRFATPEAFRDFFKPTYGPTIAVYRANADDPERTAALDQAMTRLAADHDLGGGRMEWEYLLLTARRASA